MLKRSKKPWRIDRHHLLTCMLSLYRQQIISSWFSREGNSFLQHYWTKEWDPILLGWTDEPNIIIFLINSANKTTYTPSYRTPEPWCDETLIPISNAPLFRCILYPNYVFAFVKKTLAALHQLLFFHPFVSCSVVGWIVFRIIHIRLGLWKEQIISSWFKSRQLLGNGHGM